MAQTPMPDHVDGDIFPAADYMTVKANILDLASKNTDQDAWITTHGTPTETNLGTRGANGTAFAEINTLKTKTAVALVQAAPGDRGKVTGSTSWTPTRSAPTDGGPGNGVTPTSPIGTSFVAAPSGKAKITWSSGISIDNTAGFALCGFQVRTGGTVGSGTIVQDFSDNIQIQNTGIAAECSYSNFYLLTGLTAGSTYNIQLGFRIGSATSYTAYFDRPKVMVEPVLA